MKKTLAIVMTFVMLAVMCLPVFAAGNFIDSPSNKGAPQIIEYECDCLGELIITSYRDRGTLPADEKAEFEASYASIASVANLTELNERLLKIANELGISEYDLAVSDLFYMSVRNCPGHATTYARTRSVPSEHGTFRVVLDAPSLPKFVSLMYYNAETDSWEVIENAFINEDGYLEFTTNTLGPYAIVANTGASQTGDVVMIVAMVACLAVAGAMVVVLVKTRKRV
ncbi:MAG: hypothetical protein E7616_01865 [Ruminococcaceae bacterium]|nr:hypothetical protein [Oscillospiraceae bacterium]